MMTKNFAAETQQVTPVLEFPQPLLDDISVYRGYITRFYKDSADNTIQVSYNQKTGRLVNAWADSANAGLCFTARDCSGRPAVLTWGSSGAKVYSKGRTRYIQYILSSETNPLEVGHFLLDSMRKERDFQDSAKHLLPYGRPYVFRELKNLIRNLEKLQNLVREKHLALLKANNTDTLRSRLAPQVKLQTKSTVLVEQPTFDGRHQLFLELSFNSDNLQVEDLKNRIRIYLSSPGPIYFTIKIGTDFNALTPLQRQDIFNKDFLKFYENSKSKNNRQFQRIDRQVKSVELLCYREKHLAGLPNYATYFGRDMMMATLMMEPIWTVSMLEQVIASVLKKLNASGRVSHEESLGGQAIRENAAEYNKLISEYFQNNDEGDIFLIRAEQILQKFNAVKEEYRMVDDDFQLSAIAASYLSRADVPKSRKRKFLQFASGKNDSRLNLLLKNLIYVASCTEAYTKAPVVENLISFPRLNKSQWFAGSWRDSDTGYANGRFAMDVNVVRVPKALESIKIIFDELRAMGISTDELAISLPKNRGTKLMEYACKPAVLLQAIQTWRGAVRHFEVDFTAEEVKSRILAKLQSFSEEERIFWKDLIAKNEADKKGIQFLALSLDEKGHPIPVANTDTATWLFFQDFTEQILNGEFEANDVLSKIDIFTVPYPVGLFLEDIGLTVANDAYASPEVWRTFKQDLYHSPMTIWGRDINLFLLGVAKQILAAFDSRAQIKDKSLVSYVQQLHRILTTTLNAVESSGLKYNELWSYKIHNNKLLPARYPSTCDIQLWNLTDLSVQFLLDRVSSLKINWRALAGH